VTHGVVGPGGRGVVLVDGDLDERALDVLRAEGLPVASPASLGLAAGSGTHPGGAALAALFARGTRRPALARIREGWIAAAADGRTIDGETPGDLAVAAAARVPPPRVTVFGGAWVEEDEHEYAEGLRFGALVAGAGADVVNGGYGGIMAAVSRGVREAGGTAVGVTIGSFTEHVPVNRWLTHEVEAVDLFARLPLLCDAEAWVAFPGGVGTLSEVALCWNLVQTESVEPRPLVIVGERWDRALRAFRELLRAEREHFDLVRPASTAEAAFEVVLEVLAGS